MAMRKIVCVYLIKEAAHSMVLTLIYPISSSLATNNGKKNDACNGDTIPNRRKFRILAHYPFSCDIPNNHWYTLPTSRRR